MTLEFTYQATLMPITKIETEGTDQIITTQTINVRYPITLEFDIKKSLLSNVNTANFTFYNLATTRRNLLFKDIDIQSNEYEIVLQAGFKGQQLAKSFHGFTRECYSKKEGNSTVTHLMCTNFGSTVLNAFANTAINENTDMLDVFKDLAHQLPGLTLGSIGNITGSLTRGQTFYGNPNELLQQTFPGTFIDNAQINYLNDNEVIVGQKIQIINSKTGLLGTPRKQQNYLIVPLVFRPEINIGEFVRLDLELNNQDSMQAKVMGISHRGTISGGVTNSAITELELFIGTDFIKI